ncbi:MAG TPA: DinB family protein [Vicinamibacterales bacterium]|nr:DinB family protein [Vicinamibacterales bacterium]
MMHPRTLELVRHLDTNRAELWLAVEDISPDVRERRPSPERWSVAEVLEHLAIVEARVTSRLGDAFDAARAGGMTPDAETGSVVDTAFLERANDRRTRFKTGEHAEPKGGLSADQAWAKLEETRQAFLNLLERADGLAVSAVTAQHPAFGTLNFHQWAVFLGAHDARHALQIREMADQLETR